MFRYAESVAIVLLAALSLPGCGCTTADCIDGVSIEGPISVLSSVGLNLRVSACRNGRCGSVDISSTDSDQPATGHIALSDGGQFDITLFPGPPWQLFADFRSSQDDLEDGDVYMLRVVDTTQSDVIVVDLDERVTYSQSMPNGAFCGPVCDYATIEIPPSP